MFPINMTGEIPEQPSEYEKAVLRSEFIETMKQRFLDGEDEEKPSEADDIL
jgi:hypothetical protein